MHEHYPIEACVGNEFGATFSPFPLEIDAKNGEESELQGEMNLQNRLLNPRNSRSLKPQNRAVP